MYLKILEPADADSVWEYLSSIPEDENGFINNLAGLDREAITEKLGRLEGIRDGTALPDGYVPETFYILWNEEGIPVGQFRLRHHLCDSLREGAGHIGYSVRKEYRGKGYGTEGLRLLLKEAENIVPESEAWLRVLKSNEASLKVMLKNGARIVGEDEDHWLTRIPLRTGDRKPLFSSERIDFVRVTPELVDQYLTMLNDPECCIDIRNEVVTYTRAQELLWVEKNRNATDTLFSMIEKRTGKFIGNIELFHKEGTRATLGICLTPEMQNRHFGTESIRRLLKYAFEETGFREILLDVFSFNKRAIRCYENIGFIRTGETPMSAPDGAPMSEIHMKIGP